MYLFEWTADWLYRAAIQYDRALLFCYCLERLPCDIQIDRPDYARPSAAVVILPDHPVRLKDARWLNQASDPVGLIVELSTKVPLVEFTGCVDDWPFRVMLFNEFDEGLQLGYDLLDLWQ